MIEVCRFRPNMGGLSYRGSNYFYLGKGNRVTVVYECNYLRTDEDSRDWRQEKEVALSGLAHRQAYAWIDFYVVQRILDVTPPQGGFWPVALYAALLRETKIKTHRCTGLWVKVTSKLLPFIPSLRGKSKVAALDTLVRAGLVEVRRTGTRKAPEARVLYVPARWGQ